MNKQEEKVEVYNTSRLYSLISIVCAIVSFLCGVNTCVTILNTDGVEFLGWLMGMLMTMAVGIMFLALTGTEQPKK